MKGWRMYDCWESSTEMEPHCLAWSKMSMIFSGSAQECAELEIQLISAFKDMDFIPRSKISFSLFLILIIVSSDLKETPIWAQKFCRRSRVLSSKLGLKRTECSARNHRLLPKDAAALCSFEHEVHEIMPHIRAVTPLAQPAACMHHAIDSKFPHILSV